YVPRIPSMRITDLAAAIAPGLETKTIGIRPGEKLHEEMISEQDSYRTLRVDDHYLVKPVLAAWTNDQYQGGEEVEDGFVYRSDLNDRWLDAAGLHAMLSDSI
ncbi:MAG: polysaccharide biosynthesis protein, partial [Pseudonocardiaceae bacterium]